LTLTSLDFGGGGLAPDAFEVKLLDENTGESLVDPVGRLSNSDSLLNVQSTGEIFFGSQTTVPGVAQSGDTATLSTPITITVDLAHLSQGADATLHFVLLGFSPFDSSVALDDVGLISFTAATDDVLAADANQLRSVASAQGVFQNDEAGTGGGGGLQVTDFDDTSSAGAAVTVNADGGFDYDPRAATSLIALPAGQTTADTFKYTASTFENGELTVSAPGVLAGDRDPDTDDSISISASDSISVRGATVSVNADGSFVYDPQNSAVLNALSKDDALADTFTYTISDGKGGTDTATVSITVTGVNDPPDADDETEATDESTDVTVAAPGVLDGDNDPDTNDTISISASDSLSQRGAAVTVDSDGSYGYDPRNAAELNALAKDQTTVDTFTYTISDGKGGESIGAVSITVTGINDPPSTGNDEFDVTENSELAATAPGVMVGDNDPDTTDTLIVTSGDTVSSKGAIVGVGQDGSLSYNPTDSSELNALAKDETVVDTFTYTISDGNGGSALGTVSITVTGVNDTPSADDETGETDENGALTVSAPGVLDGDSDPDTNDTLTITDSSTTSSKGATVAVSADGGYTYDPSGSSQLNALSTDDTSVDTFTYTISDGKGGESIGTVSITVTGVNDPPNAGSESASTAENALLSVSAPGLLAGQKDPDANDTLTVTAFDATSTRGAAVTVNADGNYDYDPRNSAELDKLAVTESEVDEFTYTISDGTASDTGTVTVTVTVTGVNDLPTAENDAFDAKANETTQITGLGVLQNDDDPDESDQLIVSGFDALSELGADIIVASDGSFTYDPTGVRELLLLGDGETAQDSFDYAGPSHQSMD
jgi:VCBS repeat-containing protein